MSSRYDNYILLRNENPHYRDLFDRRGINHITHYESPRMTGISVAEHLNLISQQHIWSSGDRFYKLAHSAYGDSKYWWVIAWYNKTPTEAHVQIGDILYIPLPLERILSLYGT